MGIQDSPMCNRCHSGIDSIEHAFLMCDVVNRFWADVVRYLNGLGIMSNRLTFTSKTIILGISHNIVLNRIISTGKSVILKNENLSVELLCYKLKIEISNERCMAQRRGDITKFEKVWGNVDGAVTNM